MKDDGFPELPELPKPASRWLAASEDVLDLLRALRGWGSFTGGFALAALVADTFGLSEWWLILLTPVGWAVVALALWILVSAICHPWVALKVLGAIALGLLALHFAVDFVESVSVKTLLVVAILLLIFRR